VKGLDIAGIVLACTLIITGVVLLIAGFYGAFATAGGASPLIGVGFGCIGAGISILISSAKALSEWRKDNESYSNDIEVIEDIVRRHNDAIFNIDVSSRS